MPFVITEDRPLYYACRDAGNILSAGLIEVGGLVVTGIELVSDADENTFLGAVAGSASSYNPLPNAGTWLEAGEMYGYNDGIVIVRQSHSRTEHAPEDAPALFIVYREDADEPLEWVTGESVLIGTRRTYEGKLYEALQPHVTQPDWQPNAPGILNVLWREVVEEPQTQEWQVGVSYAVNDEVVYEGSTYRCLQAHTSIQTWCPTCPGILGVLWALA